MLQRGDIVLVPFPFADVPFEKRRPALIIGIPERSGDIQIYWVAMITSSRRQPWPSDVPIAPLEGTGLKTECLVRMATLASVDEARIARRIGAIPPELLLTLSEWIASVIRD